MKLNRDFYLNNDVKEFAKLLLGKEIFVRNSAGLLFSGFIIETEAYEGITDKASHAYNNKRTERTETMYKEGGIVYVYLCYGIHFMLNIVSNKSNIPHAVLIRSIIPNIGFDFEKRNNIKYSNGPGKLTKLLGINYSFNGLSLQDDKIWIEDKGIYFDQSEITASKRIGVEYAQEDADLLYRYTVDNEIIKNF